MADALLRRVLSRLPLHVVYGPEPQDAPSRVGGRLVMFVPCRSCLARRVGASGLVGFGEAYMAGDWSAPDLPGVLEVFAAELTTLVPSWLQSFRRVAVKAIPSSSRGRLEDSRRDVSHHYDMSNDMFALFLDETLTYSSALFDPSLPLTSVSWDDLAPAQLRKVDRILDAAGVGPGTSLLEVGTGWGTLAVRAAQRGARVVSVTLSVEQALLATRRVQDAGLTDQVTIDVCDYREVEGVFDAVVSVEMVEAVGFDHWDEYFRVLSDRLAPGGRAVVQAITMPHDRMLATRDTFTWIHKYIFPGGFLPSTEAITSSARLGGLRVTERLSFGQHYARTLALWRERFTDNWDQMHLLGFDETFFRMWVLYLAT